MRSIGLDMSNAMTYNCSGSLASLPEAERHIAARTVMDLVTRKVPWGNATVLYERTSLCARFRNRFCRHSASDGFTHLCDAASPTRKPFFTLFESK